MAILIVEDDHFYAIQMAELLDDYGVETTVVGSAEQALSAPADSYDAAIIDVMLPNDASVSGISNEECRAGFSTGIALARRLRSHRADLKILLISGDMWASGSLDSARSSGIPVVMKSEGKGAFSQALRALGVIKAGAAPRAFIVHGHDEVALLQLKNYLQNTLRWSEPIVLREQANCGRTLIEKFEDFSKRVDCVFVLLTPDDKVSSTENIETRRSRQNVIFELGFFYAHFGRESGRVVVLYKGPNELPSDTQGITWIDISAGVEAAGEQIRREVAHITEGVTQAVGR
jgi:predicted nucleotide-binding protein